jgi:hypothetical protein
MSDTDDSLDLSTNAACDKQETFVKILKDNSFEQVSNTQCKKKEGTSNGESDCRVPEKNWN